MFVYEEETTKYKITEIETISLSDKNEVFKFLKSDFESPNEKFIVLYLNNKNEILKKISYGTVNSAPVYIREIIKDAIKFNSTGIILNHNHPSGILEASPQDVKITKEIEKCLELMSIRLLDHIIHTPTECKSMIY